MFQTHVLNLAVPKIASWSPSSMRVEGLVNFHLRAVAAEVMAASVTSYALSLASDALCPISVCLGGNKDRNHESFCPFQR